VCTVALKAGLSTYNRFARRALDAPDGQPTQPDTLEMRPLQAHSHRGLGILYTQIGRREQAREELSAAIALYRAMEMQFWLPQAEAALAQVM
jgi:hypothetical protein